jgi:hypothetical protein
MRLEKSISVGSTKKGHQEQTYHQEQFPNLFGGHDLTSDFIPTKTAGGFGCDKSIILFFETLHAT